MVRTIHLFLIFLSIGFFSSCGFFKQSGELNRFVNSEFSVYSVRFEEINGIDLSDVKKISDLGMVRMLAIGQQALSGKLPAKLVVVVTAQNNSQNIAAISGLEYSIFLENELYAEGSVNESVRIEPNSSVNFPVSMNVDLIKLLNSSSINQLLDIALGKQQQQKLSEMGIKIQLKPFYYSGSVLKKYPGFITIRP